MTKERMTLQVLSLAGLVACVILALWGWRTGVLTSQEQMQALVHSCGAVGVVLFILFQAVQVVVPVLPGGIGCLAGVLIFGPVWGFVYNYVGICIGSLAAFAVVRNWRQTPFDHAVFRKNHCQVQPMGRGTQSVCTAVCTGYFSSCSTG